MSLLRPARLLSFFLALFLALTLCSCGKAATDDALDRVRAELGAASSLRFTADIRADYGERVFDFTVDYASSGDGGILTVTAPELIAGAQVRYADGGTTLAVGDVEVYTGEILPGGLSPVDAVPVMTNAWTRGLVTETVREQYEGERCIAALFRIDDDTDLRTWFTERTGLPSAAEFIFDGHTVITVRFYNVEVG